MAFIEASRGKNATGNYQALGETNEDRSAGAESHPRGTSEPGILNLSGDWSLEPEAIQSCILFLALVQLSDERFRSAGHVAQFTNLAAITVKHDDGWITLNFVLFLKRGICLFL